MEHFEEFITHPERPDYEEQLRRVQRDMHEALRIHVEELHDMTPEEAEIAELEFFEHHLFGQLYRKENE